MYAWWTFFTVLNSIKAHVFTLLLWTRSYLKLLSLQMSGSWDIFLPHLFHSPFLAQVSVICKTSNCCGAYSAAGLRCSGVTWMKWYVGWQVDVWGGHRKETAIFLQSVLSLWPGSGFLFLLQRSLFKWKFKTKTTVYRSKRH